MQRCKTGREQKSSGAEVMSKQKQIQEGFRCPVLDPEKSSGAEVMSKQKQIQEGFRCPVLDPEKSSGAEVMSKQKQIQEGFRCPVLDPEKSSGAEVMSKQKQIQEGFRCPVLDPDGAVKYLEKISNVVKEYCLEQIELKKVEKYKFRIASFTYTSYRDEPGLLEEWEQFYLPDHMKMEVIGFLEEFPCDADSAELVLMVCEDGKVFAYEDERLHLVANNLKELFECGVQFPGTLEYYRGQRFEHMTEDDWAEVEKSETLIKKTKEHQKMLKDMESSFLADMAIIRQKKEEMLCPTMMGDPFTRRSPVVLSCKDLS